MMRFHVFLKLGIVLVMLPSCQTVRKLGSGLSSGANSITQPVISGSQKLAGATFESSRRIAGATISGTRKVAEVTVSGTRAVTSATAAGGRKVAIATLDGAKFIAAGATRLISFGSANAKPAPAPLTPANSADRSGPSLPAAHRFPASGLLVSEAELGPDATRLEATAVNLGGGWILNGTTVTYRLESGADDPAALLVKGRPATAVLTTNGVVTTASGEELHYHAGNQVLTLKGKASLATSTSRVEATSRQTQIRIHLPTGAISVVGPARWGE